MFFFPISLDKHQNRTGFDGKPSPAVSEPVPTSCTMSTEHSGVGAVQCGRWNKFFNFAPLEVIIDHSALPLQDLLLYEIPK